MKKYIVTLITKNEVIYEFERYSDNDQSVVKESVKYLEDLIGICEPKLKQLYRIK